MINPKFQKLFQSFKLHDGVYLDFELYSGAQGTEYLFRRDIASKVYFDYYTTISRSHSIPVMDAEVDSFLKMIPINGIILDIGGGWGWHWRRLASTRPDICVVILDFVKENFLHAHTILGDLIGKNIALLHSDATNLPFTIDEEFTGFDGVWSVQTLQHIPNFKIVVAEAHRVLKVGASFANYSLNYLPIFKFFKHIFGKDYSRSSKIQGSYWLFYASNEQKEAIEVVFSNNVIVRFTEIIYTPELRFFAPGTRNSLLGKVDAKLSNKYGFLRHVSRQCSFHTFKVL